MPTELHVAVGVIESPAGEILIARRAEHSHQGGLWEFPGGKLEPGESVIEALRRELREELAIEVELAAPLLQVRHSYPDRRVLLDVWKVQGFTGQARGAEDQPVRWVPPGELGNYPFPAANRPIIAAARLPDRYAILDLADEDEALMMARLQALAASGLRMIQLRANALTDAALLRLARPAVTFCRGCGISLLLNAAPELAHQLGADGIHLTARRGLSLNRRPLGAEAWVAMSCHNAEELRHAELIGADFAVLGPVEPTATHPGVRPLGWRAFRAWVAGVNLPVYALGGMVPAHIPKALEHGAQGIAGIRGIADDRVGVI
ncbi:Nudix family hydrolase [Methylococcus sp. EFPC2]|uniref:Nudix family hydrolase n=1 Tax=Methylococcus sp. EFPC2 TaxID=2812648 RepID=UPI00196839F4|nr:Nudix family hydrolase [Methylococcus sp. EFPC2]QSA95915.1 Nudix family hydrolase [Methylococcus sp. EFPC2]